MPLSRRSPHAPLRPAVVFACLTFFVAGRSAQARDVTLKVHDMAGALPAGTPVEVQLLRDDGGPLGAPLLPRDDGAAPDAVAGDHLYTAPLVGLAVDHGGLSVRAAGRTWTGGFAYDATSDAVLLVGLEPSGLAAASTRELSFAQGPPVGGVPSSGVRPGDQGTEGGPAPLRNASPSNPGSPPSGAGTSPSSVPSQTAAVNAAHAEAGCRGWALLGVGLGCLSAAAWFGARHRAG